VSGQTVVIKSLPSSSSLTDSPTFQTREHVSENAGGSDLNGGNVHLVSNGHGSCEVVDWPTSRQLEVHLPSSSSSVPFVNQNSSSPMVVHENGTESRMPSRDSNTEVEVNSLEEPSATGLHAVLSVNRPQTATAVAVDHTNADTMQTKDGHYFLQLMQAEENRINSLCAEAELDLNGGTISDEGTAGRLRATIGKAHLLTTKKFQQFYQLCDKNLTQDVNEQYKTTSEDLAGFWDLVMIQIEDIQRMFTEIEALRRNGWKEEIGSSLTTNAIQTTSTLNTLSHSRPTSSVARSSPAVAKSKMSPRGAKSDAAKVAREEARKQLMMVKAAGRQRKLKASETDDAEVQIFMP
jgi:hypothetical protein